MRVDPYEVQPRAVGVQISFDDGTILAASGPDANSIWQHWMNCEKLAAIHGQYYHGPKLKETKIT